MVVHRDTGKIEHKVFKDVLGFYHDKDVMVVNNTKVFPARLYGRKEKTGAKIEVFLLRELKRKLPALSAIEVEHDWWGWVCLTADFLPHVYHAGAVPSVHYALGYQGSGVAYGLHAGRLLASRIAGRDAGMQIPSTSTPLPRFPLAALRRAGQRAMYMWYRYQDERD